MAQTPPHPDPTPYTYATEIFSHSLKDDFRPPITFNSFEWESLAKDRLSADAWGYVWGSAGRRETDNNNLAAFRKWGILPRRLIKAGFPTLKTRLFGMDHAYPVAIAPVGVQTIFHPQGEAATARAARKEDVTYIMSTAASTSIEDVAQANTDKDATGVGTPGSRWYQLYWPLNKHNDITASLLSRAKAAGYKVLVVTLDTFMLGWRPSDLNNAYNPFLRADAIGVEVGFSDPVFRRQFRQRHGKEIEDDVGTAAQEWAHIMFPGFSHGWEDVAFLKQHWGDGNDHGPIVLKGIQTVEDAKRAVEIGIQGIIVSNHGGRQLDGGVGSLDVLAEIVDAVGDRLEVLFDSGVRCGADIAKALALGAKMVLIGRPYVYGLALQGEDGVRHVLRSLLGELEMTLHLSGIPSVSSEHLNRDFLRGIT